MTYANPPIAEWRMLIDGELVPSSSGAVFENVNPATDEVIGVTADGTREGFPPRHRIVAPRLRRDRLVAGSGVSCQVHPAASGRAAAQC